MIDLCTSNKSQLCWEKYHNMRGRRHSNKKLTIEFSFFSFFAIKRADVYTPDEDSSS